MLFNRTSVIPRLLALACFLPVAGNANAVSDLIKMNDFSTVGELSKSKNIPIVVLVEQSGCQYCEIVSEEFLYPLQKSRRFKDKAIFRRISLDTGETIIGPDLDEMTTDAFCGAFDATFTPTVLFLDGDGEPLTEKILGMSSRDYYGYDLEQSIMNAYDRLRTQ